MPTSEEINSLINVLEVANSNDELNKIQAAHWLYDFIQAAAKKAVSELEYTRWR